MKKLLQIMIVLTALLLLISLYMTIPKIRAEKIVYGNYNDDYVDKVEAKSLFKDYSNNIITKGKIDVSKVGKYTLEYELNFLFFKIKEKKDVIIKDTKKPVISLNGEATVYVCPNKVYEEEGYVAVDEYDGDITNNVIQEIEENQIIYRVKDNADNFDEVVRKIEYLDDTKPTITLNGSANITLYQNTKYEENGYSASDNCDGDITSSVVVESNVNEGEIGEYEIKYTVSDNASNTISVIRNVKIIPRPVISSNTSTGGGIGSIYLTFDDGPSALTEQILKILDEENVKATFFVTSAVNTYPSILASAYNKGNAICLHTYTHDYSYIYASSDNYFSDLTKIRSAINNIIGISPNIIRFPGGSSNTVSRNYNVGIMSSLTKSVVNNGYNYFDWNVDSDDAGGAYQNSSRIYTNVVNNLSHNKVNVVLMHDSNGHNATVAALRDIIRFGKNNGYSFDVITNNTKSVRHGVNN